MKVDMQLIKQLREATFAPLKDCKEVLVEAEGDLERAQELLREKGITKAGKKADRETNEGSVKLLSKDGWLFGVKVLCETDFVAKNETFAELIDVLLDKLVEAKQVVDSMDNLSADLLEDMNNTVAEFVGKIWENVRLWDVVVSDQKAYVYNHPGNKVSSIVYYEGEGEEVAKELALQVAAMSPTYLSFDSVSQDYKDELMAKFVEELKESGKPENMIGQIAEGKLRKALSESVLLEQEYIRDGSKKVKDIIPEGVEIKSFLRYSV